MNGIDRTPSIKTLRFYFRDSPLTDNELYFLAKWFAINSGKEFIKPKNNIFFKGFVKYAEKMKENGYDPCNV